MRGAFALQHAPELFALYTLGPSALGSFARGIRLVRFPRGPIWLGVFRFGLFLVAFHAS